MGDGFGAVTLSKKTACEFHLHSLNPLSRGFLEASEEEAFKLAL